MARTPYHDPEGETTFNKSDVSNKQLAGDVIKWPLTQQEIDERRLTSRTSGDSKSPTPLRPENK